MWKPYRVSVLMISALLVGCSYRVVSPPARMAPLESPATLPVGTNGLAAEGGFASATFGPEVIFGSVRYRRRLIEEQLDGSIEVNGLHVLGGTDVSTFREAYSLHLGLKYRMLGVLSLVGGVGGGGSAAGGFISPDVGFIAGFEKPYVIPFISVRGFLSQPFAAREIDLGIDDDERKRGTPQTTFGLVTLSGVRVPLSFDGFTTHSLALGFTGTIISDRHKGYGFLGFVGNFEVVF